MEDKEDRALIISALLAEASRLGDAIAERHAAAERFISVAGALAGIALTLGLRDDQWPILAGLPIGLAVIILYMIQIYTDAGMHGGHRKAIELHLEREFDQVVLVGQSRVAAAYARRRSVLLTLLFTFTLWAGLVILGFLAIYSNVFKNPSDSANVMSIGILCLYVLLIGFASYVFCLAIKENSRAEKEAEQLAQGAWLSR